jgi:hypothetical protein
VARWTEAKVGYEALARFDLIYFGKPPAVKVRGGDEPRRTQP